MKKLLYVILSVSFSLQLSAQISQRVEINGRIIVSANDVEGVTVYNTSSNKGTITNDKGEFTIEVRMNDIVEFSALQFEKFSISIDEEILTNRYVTVYLVERINKLDEVVITPYDMLTGNLVVDVESVETFNPDLDAIYFGVNDIYAYEFTDDYKSGVENMIMREGEYYNNVDVIGVLGMVLKPIFKNKNKKKKTREDFIPSVSLDTKDLSDIYGRQFFVNSLNIPEDKVESFVAFVNNEEFDQTLLDKKNEVKLIEHLYNKSKLFLKSQNGKE